MVNIAPKAENVIKGIPFHEINLSWEQGEAEYYLEDDVTREVLFGGSAGPGKTFFGCGWQLRRRCMNPDTWSAMSRNELKDLKDTTLMTFFEVADIMGLRARRHYTYKEQAGRIVFPNKSLIFLRDLKFQPSDKNYNTLGSLTLSDAFTDQAEECTLKAIQVLNTRIRRNLIGGQPKHLLCANPENNWLKHRHVSDKANKPIAPHKRRKFVVAFLHSNPNKEFAEAYLSNLEEGLDEYDKARLIHGDWSVIENDRPFFDLFSEKRNVSKFGLKIDPYTPLSLSFDFNINPTTCVISQKLDNVGCRTYDVLEAIGTEALCWLVKEFYGKHPAGLLISGDHSGNAGSSSAGVLAGGVYNSDFEQIKIILGLTDHDLIDTHTANARHEYSRRLCRHFFSKVPYLIDGTNERCQSLRSDLQNGKFINGKLFKNRETGNEQDKGDAFRYQVNAWFQGQFNIIDDYSHSLG